jgi:hypothetical protein
MANSSASVPGMLNSLKDCRYLCAASLSADFLGADPDPSPGSPPLGGAIVEVVVFYLLSWQPGIYWVAHPLRRWDIAFVLVGSGVGGFVILRAGSRSVSIHWDALMGAFSFSLLD